MSTARRHGRLAVVLWLFLVMVPPRTSSGIQGATSGAAPTSRQEVTALAELRSVHQAFAWFRLHENRLRDWQLEMTAIPAPPFGEEKRGQWLAQRFREIGLQQVEIDEVGNVVGVRPGTAPDAKCVAIIAHIDTVFPAAAEIRTRRDGDRLHGPGVTDNGAGVTAMLAVAAALNSAGVSHRSGLLFVGNVGEEGEGDLRGVRHLFEESQWKDRIAYSVVVDGSGTESLVTQALGSRRFEVTVNGPGGHSWSDFGVPNPIVILSRAIAAFSQSEIPSDPKTTFNMGVISGGTSVNSIPESASVRVDIRSSAAEEISRLEELLREAVQQAVEEAGGGKQRSKVSYHIKQIGSRPAAELPANARILAVTRAVNSHLGIQSRIRRASTDANIPLAQGREAISLGAGGTGGGVHTLQEWYEPANRDLGLKRILLMALTLAGTDVERGKP